MKSASGFLVSMLLFSTLATTLNLSLPFSEHDSYIRESAECVYIGNSYIEIGFSKSKGSILSLIDKMSDVDLRKEKNSPQETWALVFYTETKERFLVTNEETISFALSTETWEEGCRLRFRWQGFSSDVAGIYHQIQANVNLTLLDNSQISTWRLEIINEGDFGVDQIRFPSIWGVRELGEDGEDDVLVCPSKEGRLFFNPFVNHEYVGAKGPSGFLNMQFMAYYDEEAGFYFATYDAEGHSKRFSWDRLYHPSEWAGIYINHYPVPETKIETPYNTVIGVFHGDWYDAANIYSNWAHKQWWCKEETAQKSPFWLLDSAYSWNVPTGTMVSTSYNEVLEAIRNGSKYFQQQGLADLKWGWQNNTNGWPSGDYFPPRDGWSEFDRFIGQMHDLGMRLYLYISPLWISNNTDLWKSGAPLNYTQKTENGQTITSYWEGSLYTSMCTGTDYWKQKLRETILTLAEHKVDLIQLDGFPWCCDSMQCYDLTHGHPLGGGGNWIVQNWIDLLENMTREAKAIYPDMAFAGEGVAENFLPYLDLKMMRDIYVEVHEDNPWGGEAESTRNGTEAVVPLFNYVYHRYIMGQENYDAGLNVNFKQYNWLAYSRALNWGEIPGVEIYIGETLGMEGVVYDQITDLAGYDYTRRIALARETYARDFVVCGKLAKSLLIESRNVSIVHNWFGLNFTVMKPAIQHTAWVSDWGGLGLVFTNISLNETVSFNVSFDPALYGLPDQSYVYCVRDGVYTVNGVVSGSFNSTFEMNAREVDLLVFVPVTEPRCDLRPSIHDLPYSGSSLYVNRSWINVTVWNNGPVPSGIFNVSLLTYWKDLNATEVLAKETVSNLDPGSDVTLPFTFQTAHTGDCTLMVAVDSDNSTAELNEMNNEMSVDIKAEVWATDLNQDGSVNILDISIVARAYGSRQGEPEYSEAADLDKNGTVNILDISAVAKDYGKTV